VDVEEIIGGLYGLPLNEFTRARDSAARDLRKAGRRAEATYVGEQRKPTAAAAAVNALVRAHRVEVDRFLGAAAALRDAQVGGRGDVQAATRQERDALARLVGLGGATVRQSLQAAAVDSQAAADLLAGRLTQELEPPGFGTLLDHTRPASGARPRPRAPAKPRPAARIRERPRPDDRAERERLAQVKRTLAAAQSELRRAERDWNRARADVAKAEAAVEKARAALQRVRAR
jgi:hypothetical protein